MVIAAVTIVGDEFLSKETTAESILIALASPSLLCILGSRLFFNLKDAAERSVGSDWSSYSPGAVGFDQLQFDLEP